jgi:uncharacterized membrane protein YbhN (UPF0104 family)
VTALWSAISQTAAVVSRANVALIGAAFAVDTLSLFVMTFRWRLFLRAADSHVTFRGALLAYSAGVCVCNITPARTLGGDACRAALIPRPDGSPSLRVVASTVVFDRMTDTAGFLMLGFIAAPVLKPNSPPWTTLALLCAAVALIARLLYRRLAPRIRRWLPNGIGPANAAVLSTAVGCSLMIWSLDVMRVMLVSRAFNVRLIPAQAAAVSLLRLGSGLVPVPGGIGVVDGALVAGFVWLGVPATTAAALAIVERAIVYGWGTALGAVSLLLLGGKRAWQRARAGTDGRDLSSDARR